MNETVRIMRYSAHVDRVKKEDAILRQIKKRIEKGPTFTDDAARDRFFDGLKLRFVETFDPETLPARADLIGECFKDGYGAHDFLKSCKLDSMEVIVVKEVIPSSWGDLDLSDIQEAPLAELKPIKGRMEDLRKELCDLHEIASRRLVLESPHEMITCGDCQSTINWPRTKKATGGEVQSVERILKSEHSTTTPCSWVYRFCMCPICDMPLLLTETEVARVKEIDTLTAQLKQEADAIQSQIHKASWDRCYQHPKGYRWHFVVPMPAEHLSIHSSVETEEITLNQEVA